MEKVIGIGGVLFRSNDPRTLKDWYSGVEVTVDSQSHPNGRFARLHDPKGKPVELREPCGEDGDGTP